MCPERADIMYSVEETARKIMCTTEGDEMNVKRIARYLKGVPIAKCLIQINRFPPFVNVYTDSDWAGQNQTCKSTSGGVTQWGSTTLPAWSRTPQSVRLSSADAELYALTTGISEGIVTKHLLKELGYEVTLRNHVPISEGMGIQTRFGADETCDAEVHDRASRRGEEANDACLRKHEFEQRRPDDKVTYI